MPAAHRALESDLSRAFSRGEFRRLAEFARWCAAEVAVPDMNRHLRSALELLAGRTGLAPEQFNRQAEALLCQLPLAATVIGLRRGDPAAMRMLTIAAALSPGPLSAAVRASRNHRLYERTVADRVALLPGAERPAAIVALATAEVSLGDDGAPPSVSEVRCAERQLAAWQALETALDDRERG
jgi:hypothetical protein